MNNLKNIFFFLGSLLLGLTAFYAFQRYIDADSDSQIVHTDSPTSNRCLNPSKIAFEFDASFITTKEMEKFKGINDNTVEAIRYHLNYLKGYFHFLENQYYLILPTKIKIEKVLKVANAPYPINLATTPYDLFHENFIPQQYRSKIDIKKGSPAVEIHYKAAVEAIHCSNSVPTPQQITFELPRDPYLLYWQIPRMDLSFNGKSAKLPKCVSNRFVLEKKPKNFWYFWKPRKDIQSSKNCLEILQEKNLIRSYTVDVKNLTKKNKSQNLDKLHQQKEIKLTFLYGILESSNFLKKIEKINEKILDLRLFSKKGNTINDQKLKQLFAADIDIMGKAGIDIIHRIQSQLLTPYSLTGELQSDNSLYKINLSGFSKNNQKIDIDLYILDSYSEHKSRFSKVLADSLANSHIITYLGHSNHGQNFKLDRLKQDLDLTQREFSDIFKKMDFQILINLSCFSTAYHSNNYFKLRSGLNSIQVLAGSEGFIAYFPIAVIDAINNKTQFINLKKYISNQDVLFLEQN